MTNSNLRIKYKLSEEDYLQFLLYATDQMPRTARKVLNGRIGVTVTFLILGWLMYSNNKEELFLPIYFWVMAVVSALFYKKYFKWRYRKHFRKHVRETYQGRIGKEATLEIGEEEIRTEDPTGEGKSKISEIEAVNETSEHFFLKMSNGMSIIIPKRSELNPAQVRDTLMARGLKIEDFHGWKW